MPSTSLGSKLKCSGCPDLEASGSVIKRLALSAASGSQGDGTRQPLLKVLHGLLKGCCGKLLYRLLRLSDSCKPTFLLESMAFLSI